MAAPLPRRHVARAAWANTDTTLPPIPNPACCRANTRSGPCRQWEARHDHVAHAGNGVGGTLAASQVARQHLPPLH
jgi:hypothetical protein